MGKLFRLLHQAIGGFVAIDGAIGVVLKDGARHFFGLGAL